MGGKAVCYCALLVWHLAMALPPTAELVQTTHTHCDSAWCQFTEAWYYMFLGILCICMAFPCLYWNEGRAVARYKALDYAKSEVRPIQSIDLQIEPANEDKLLHMIGRPHVTVNVQADPDFSVASAVNQHVKALDRNVQMWQWIEVAHEEKRRIDEDTTETTIVPDPPRQDWGPVPPNQVTAVDPANEHNLSTGMYRNVPPAPQLLPKTFVDGHVEFGQYRPSSGMVNSLMGEDQGTVQVSHNKVQEIRDKFLNADYIQKEDHDLVEDHLLKGDQGPPAYNETEGRKTAEAFLPGGPTWHHLATTPFHATNDGRLIVGLHADRHAVGDYKLEWVERKLKTDSDGSPINYTIMAAQHTKGDQGTLRAWAEHAETFEIDSCCYVICPCGTNIIEKTGCVAVINKAISGNTVDDGEQTLTVEDDNAMQRTATTTSDEEEALRNNAKAAESMIEYVIPGTFTVEQVIEQGSKENEAKTNAYRAIGACMLFLGFQFMMSPFPKMFQWIPILGGLVGAVLWCMIILVACMFCTVGGSLTIGLAWVRYRPLLGIGLVLVTLAIVIPTCIYA